MWVFYNAGHTQVKHQTKVNVSQPRFMTFSKPIRKYKRVSSKYGMRKHPILRKRKMHTGIDYAAPNGTPIHSTEKF